MSVGVSFVNFVSNGLNHCVDTICNLMVTIAEKIHELFLSIFNFLFTEEVVVSEERFFAKPMQKKYIDELENFPWQKYAIIREVIEWARSTTARPDPTQPIYEIIQEAFKYKSQLRGYSSSTNIGSYSVSNHFHRFDNKFEYIIGTLIGFQELSREENRRLFDFMDEEGNGGGGDLLYEYATYISKIYSYPPVGMGAMKNKLQLGIGACFETYKAAKEKGRILEFFKDGFDEGGLCFDARVNSLQNFHQRLLDRNKLPTRVEIGDGDDFVTKVGKYWTAFVNTQINQYVEGQKDFLDPQELRENIQSGSYVIHASIARNLITRGCSQNIF